MSDLSRLGLLSANLRTLAGIGRKAAPDMADALTLELIKNSRAGVDPYGKKHAPLKRPRRSGRTGPPLVDSGASYKTTRFYPYAEGVAGVLGGHLPRHMLATTSRVARAAFPRGTMPAAWRRAIERAILLNAPKVLV